MLALGSDHGGFALKEAVKRHLDEAGIPYRDYGVALGESCDYPLTAVAPCEAVTGGQCERAILFCGTGVGISMAANKIKGIRAVVCTDPFSARYARLHNDANALCLGGRVLGEGLAIELVDIFISTGFEGGRHARRVEQIMRLETQN